LNESTGRRQGEAGPRAGGLVLPLVLSLLAVAVYGVYFSQDLNAGSPRHYDAYYSLVRSIGFLDTGDWLAVHRNHQPDFRKPPLQYMLTALCMKAGMDDLQALRLWPFVFALGTLLGTILLTHLVAPRSPWAMPSAVLLLASSLNLAEHARMGLLETGMVLLLVLSVCAVFLAERSPRWWVAAGVLIGLGFLQKVPIALAVCVPLVGALCWLPGEPGYSWKALRRSLHFRIGSAIALLLCAFWPLVQTLRFGSKYLEIQLLRQIVYRLHPQPPPGLPGSGPEPLRWLDWLRFDSQWAWLLCLGLLLTVFVAPRFRRNGRLLLCSIYVALAIAVLAAAGGEVYPRYILVFIPFLAVVGGVVLAQWIPWPPLSAGIAAALLASNALALAEVVRPPGDGDGDRMARARIFRDKLEPNETPIFFYAKSRRLEFPPPAFLYYADLDRRVMVFDRDALGRLGPAKVRRRLPPPLQGLSHRDDYPMAQRYLGPLVEAGRHGDYVVWKSARQAPLLGTSDSQKE
jgi:4-amino-4-deoxy-L-arabinose transferase-like glycosyltransferase